MDVLIDSLVRSAYLKGAGQVHEKLSQHDVYDILPAPGRRLWPLQLRP